MKRLREKFFYKPETEQDRINRLKIQAWRKTAIDYFEEPLETRIAMYAKELRKNNVPLPPRVLLAERKYEQNLF